MRFERVSREPAFTACCVWCARTVTNTQELWADLDGKPFVDYYHPPCMEEAKHAARAKVQR